MNIRTLAVSFEKLETPKPEFNSVKACMHCHQLERVLPRILLHDAQKFHLSVAIFANPYPTALK